jgi:DNA-binding NarL/FixJ family response regulator
LSIVHASEHPPDLLISDIDLSASRSGVDLARELAAENPSTRVLLISGGNSPGALPASWRFLAKPFPTAKLLDCVGELCLAARPAA